MTVRWETTLVDGKPMRIYLGIPDRPGKHPVILVAQHGGGVDEQMQDVVHRLFREGYVVAVPELFHRLPKDTERGKRVGLLRDDEIIADFNATIGHLKALGSGSGPLGIVGFCMGGRASYLAATAIREIKAAAIFYGGNIMKAQGDGPSPFERSSGIQCPIIAFTGTEDTNPSPDDMKKIDNELTRLNKVHEFHLYLKAAHAFQNFLEARYCERVARASWTEMLAFFTEHLKRGVT